jgi:UDP-N-acetylglucosamine:LPS N-acetylglucosamine transferase
MKVLLLTSQLGYGHVRAANAIEQALQDRYPDVECDYLDLWSLMDEKVATAVKDGYLRMTQEYPDYYQKLYDLDKNVWQQLSGEVPLDDEIKQFLSDQQSAWFSHQPRWLPLGPHDLDSALVNGFIRRLVNQDEKRSYSIVLRSLLLLMQGVLLHRLKQQVAARSPDVVVATQMYPAALFSHLKQKPPFRNIPALGILTDYGLQKVWVRPNIDVYCVACQAVADQLAAWDVPATKIYETGIPLDQQFGNSPSQTEARVALQLHPKKPTVLVTGGQYGIGLTPTVEALCKATAGVQLLVTAGNAGSEKEALQRLQQAYPAQVSLFDWVENMAQLIAAADVVVGKPGGLSVSEALACGRPFFATCSLGGQEGHNVQFLRQQGIGDKLDPSQLATRLNRLFAEPELLAAMQKRAYSAGHREAAQQVVMQIIACLPASNRPGAESQIAI